MRESCYYCNCTGECEGCEFYDPVTDEAIDKTVGEYIEEKRYEFYAEWFQYIS